MSESTTRIVDLPDGKGASQTGMGQTGMGQAVMGPPGMASNANAYIPMNVHPNPYGLSPDNVVMPHPQQDMANRAQQPQMSVPMSGQLSQEEQMMLNNLKPQRLPSRDIPMDTTTYQQDEQIMPTYIPKSKQQTDYVRDYEHVNEKKIEEHERKKNRAISVDDLIDEIQIPICIGILFLLFNLSFSNTLIIKYFAFMGIVTSDGNLNFNGSVLKSVMFGLAFYVLTKTINYLGDL